MNPAVAAKKASVTATKTRSFIAFSREKREVCVECVELVQKRSGLIRAKNRYANKPAAKTADTQIIMFMSIGYARGAMSADDSGHQSVVR